MTSYLLFITNAWHQDAELIAVASSHDRAVGLAQKHSGDNLEDDDIATLKSINQTQGLELNYSIQEATIDKLLDE